MMKRFIKTFILPLCFWSFVVCLFQNRLVIVRTTTFQEIWRFTNESQSIPAPNNNNNSTSENSFSLVSPPLAINHSSNESSLALEPWSTARLVDNSTQPANGTLSSWFFVNYIQTTQIPQNPSCHRTCTDFRNNIYLSPTPGEEGAGAGLIDALTTFGTVHNVAGFLCARVYVPRPKFCLGARHNANQTLSPNMSWSEFGDFRQWNDPLQQPALLDWDNPDDLAKWPEEASLFNMSTELLKYSKFPRQVKADFAALKSFSFAQQRKKRTIGKDMQDGGGDDNDEGFIWIIKADYFAWCNMLASQLRNVPPSKKFKQQERQRQSPFIFSSNGFYMGCQYAKVGLTPDLQDLRDKIVHQILQNPTESASQGSPTTTAAIAAPPLVGYFHIRRKDASLECDTSLTRLAGYLNCSLGDAILTLSKLSSSTRMPIRRQRVIVLYSSDDDNPEYRSNVKNLIEQQQLRSLGASVINVTAVDVDRLVEQILRMEVATGRIPPWRLNSFYIFQLIFSIGYNQGIAQFHMERRRGLDCRECDNVTDQLIQSGALYSSLEQA